MKWAALALAAVFVVSMLWIAAEQHYRNCIEHANATPGNILDERVEIAGCSRLPF